MHRIGVRLRVLSWGRLTLNVVFSSVSETRYTDGLPSWTLASRVRKRWPPPQEAPQPPLVRRPREVCLLQSSTCRHMS